MPKESHRANYRVVTEPISKEQAMRFWLVGEPTAEEFERQACERIKADIKRHVDDVWQIYVESDDASVCSFCSSKWTEDSGTYNGGCCDEDEANNPNPEEAAA